MSQQKKYKRDHAVPCALNFGEYTALMVLLDQRVPLPPEDADDDSAPTTVGGRLRTLLMQYCREAGIQVKLSATPRLPSFPKHPGVFKTPVEERHYNRVYRQVWEQRQRIMEDSPDYRKKTADALEQARLQREARDKILEAESDVVDNDLDDEPLPTDRGVLDNATLPDEPATPLPNSSPDQECWCSDPLDPEIHSLHPNPGGN